MDVAVVLMAEDVAGVGLVVIDVAVVRIVWIVIVVLMLAVQWWCM